MSSKLFNFRIFQIKLKRYSTKRKYPINPEHADKLPVFDYGVSKSTYNRLFVWGTVSTGALGIPYKTRELKLVEFVKFPKRLAIAEEHEVTTIGCGLGFTAFGINSKSNEKLYGTGLNTDSQIGYHEVKKERPLEIIFLPQPISLPFTNSAKTKIRKIDGGRAHLAVLTDEGLFCLGNNAYGQCGRTIIADEKYLGSRFIHHVKDVEGKKIVDVVCGQDHSVALTEDGSVYACGWGADGQTGLGHYNSQSQFTKVQGDISSEKIIKVACKADFVLALSNKGQVFGWGNTEYGQITTENGDQQICNPTFIDMCKGLGKIIDVASGGTSCLILNEEGHVFVWGYGILGTGPAVQYSKVPIQIPATLFGINDFQPNTHVVSVASGINHFCAITNNGDLYSWGRNNGCCLGLGDDKDQFFPLRVSLGGLVTKVVCGVDHTVAMCKPFV